MAPEAPLESTKFGLRPGGEGWFVDERAATAAGATPARSARSATSRASARFPGLGINLERPAARASRWALYHRENAQEDFLVLAGECLLIVEGEERKLKTWDFFHCPPGTEHIIVGAGKEPAVVLAVGARGRRRKGLVYPVSEAALKHERRRRRRRRPTRPRRTAGFARAGSARSTEDQAGCPVSIADSRRVGDHRAQLGATPRAGVAAGPRGIDASRRDAGSTGRRGRCGPTLGVGVRRRSASRGSSSLVERLRPEARAFVGRQLLEAEAEDLLERGRGVRADLVDRDRHAPSSSRDRRERRVLEAARGDPLGERRRVEVDVQRVAVRRHPAS